MSPNVENMKYLSLEDCIIKLHEIGVIKFGDFVLKSGIKSPIYFDLRIIISYPYLLESVSKLIWEQKSNNYDLICGVPYTALPIATVISTSNDVPMIIRRKEMKTYGTKKILEGNYEQGQSCLIVEDVIVSGMSVYETAQLLRKENLKVTDAVVFLDREQGGVKNLADLGIKIKAVITATEMLKILSKSNKLDKKIIEDSLNFLRNHSTVPLKIKLDPQEVLSQSLEHRLKSSSNILGKKILNIIGRKKTNLCLAADVDSSEELLDLAEKVGPHICVLKTHINLLTDFTKETAEKLKFLSSKHDFLLFEDSKFGDIGNTVAKQYSSGLYRISEWADIVTVHGVPGPGVLKGLSSVLKEGDGKGFLIVAEMNTEGTLTNSDYIQGCCSMAEEFSDRVIGFVGQNKVTKDSKFLQFTPGVSLKSSGDKLGQKYKTPEEALCRGGADVIIVGRGITSEPDVQVAAQKYQREAFKHFNA